MSNKAIGKMEIKELNEVKLVGFRVFCEGDQYQEEIPQAAALLKNRVSEIKNILNDGRQVGAFIVDAPSDDLDGYWVCVQVSEYGDIPDDMVTLTVPPQKYATIMHNGANHFIMNSYEKLHHWIADNHFRRADQSWNLEFYQRIVNTPEDVLVELYDSIY